MPEPTGLDPLPQATVDPPRRTRLSVIWIIPILAAVVAIGIAVQRIVTEGPTITVVFKSAEGIEAGKTFVKYKDVTIGHVTKVELADTYGNVEVTAKISKRAARLMVDDAKFWVVEPRVTLSGISGLGTLLSGNYIGFQPGKSDKKQTRFTGLEVAPVITDQPGRRFVLKAKTLGSLGIGSPIYYRQLPAGQIEAYALAADGKGIDIAVFVTAPYEKYVTPETRFWNASGIDVSVGAGGVNVRTEGLVALLAGGLAFDVPSFAAPAGPAAAGAVFTLYSDQATAMKQPEAIYFPDAPKPKIDWTQDPLELPVVLSTIPDLEAKLTGILAKLDSLPWESIGREIQNDLTSLKRTLEDTSKLLSRLDTELVDPLKTTLEETRRAIASADRVLTNTDATLVGKDAPVQQDLRDALQEMVLAARSLRVLTDYLERHPESLIRGKTQENK